MENYDQFFFSQPQKKRNTIAAIRCIRFRTSFLKFSVLVAFC